MSTMETREQRRARNKAAHAIRRELTNADYAAAKLDGATISWRAIAETYDAIPAETILAEYAETTPVAAVQESAPAPKKRRAPAHIEALLSEYVLAREVWLAGLEDAIAGGHSLAAGGRPARGEKYPDEERDYRAAHPEPLWKDFLSRQNRQSGAVA